MGVQTWVDPAAPPRRAAPGVSVGYYRLVRRIGRGGMGEVWEALDGARRVAVKVMRRGGVSPTRVRRFVREAHVTTEIAHPNVIPTIDVGWWSGRPYLVMPLVRGESLDHVIAREAPMPLARVIELLDGVAAGLDAIHEAGVVHRDLTPRNVLVAPNGESFILDFGLARRDDDTRLTEPGTISGTPEYMSPEAALGAAPDRRGDVYSFATIAFRMLTGRLPYGCPDPIQTLVAKTRLPAPTLTEAGRPSMGGVEPLLAAALDTDPDARPASAGGLLQALREARPPERVESSVEARWRIADYALIAACLALTAALVVFATIGALAP